MSIPADNAADRYVGDTITVSHAFNFSIAHAGQLVARQDSFVMTYGTHYLITGIGDTDGGTVNWFTAPGLGVRVTLTRRETNSQETTYVENEAYNPLKIQRDFDHVIRVTQMLEEFITRAPKLFIQSPYNNLTIDDPVSNYFLKWKADLSGIENVIALDAGELTASLTAGGVVFADGAASLNTDAQLTWDNVNKILDAGTAKFSADINITPVFSSPSITTDRATGYLAFSDVGDHANSLHTVAAISAYPVGSGTNGPASADVGLTISNIKQDVVDSTVLGEIDGLYVFMRQGPQGDASGVLVDIGAYDSTSFTSSWESNNTQISNNVIVHSINTQIGVIHPDDDNRIGYVATATVGNGTVGYFLGGTWTVGISLTDATLGTGIAFGNGHTIGWRDNTETLRQVIAVASDNILRIGFSEDLATNGHIVFRGGDSGNELIRLLPSGEIGSGETAIGILRWHDGAAEVESAVTVGIADSGGSGFRVLRVEN